MIEMLQFRDNPSHKRNPPLLTAEPEDHSVIRLSRVNPGRLTCNMQHPEKTRNARNRILDQEIQAELIKREA